MLWFYLRQNSFLPKRLHRMKTNNLNFRYIIAMFLLFIAVPAFGMRQQQRNVRFADSKLGVAIEMRSLLRTHQEAPARKRVRCVSARGCLSRNSFALKIVAATTALVGWLGFCHYLTKDLTDDQRMATLCAVGAIKPWDCQNYFSGK